MLTRRAALAAGLSGLALAPRSTFAQSNPPIRIGIIQDATGPNSHLAGANSVACARMAGEEFASSHGVQVEFLTADHQNKADLAASIARQWLDQGVDAMLEFNNSAVALAINTLLRDRDKVMLANNVGSSVLSGKECTPNMTHWTFDTAMLARCLGTTLSEQGGDTWYFIRRADVFGRSLRDEAGVVVESKGGRVVGEIPVSLGTPDFSSELLQAQRSGAKIVALALAGNDLLNCLKQAQEFGLQRAGQKVVSLIIYEQDIRSLGLRAAQGTQLANSFYWDLNDRTRAFSKRVQPRTGGDPPNMGQAGAYAAVQHYLKAVADVGVAQAKRSGRATVARMKQIPISDEVFANARIREDGRVVSDAYVFEVKAPDESTGEWDLLKLRSTLGPDQAWRPLAEGGCPLVKT